MRSLAEAHPKPQHGASIAGTKFAQFSALWAIELLSPGSTLLPEANRLQVSTSFEGGSAQVLSIDQEHRLISFTPGGDPERGWPCWWYFRIDGLKEGDTATLELQGSPLPARNQGKNTGKPLGPGWAMPDRATFSTDGTIWKHTDPGVLDKGRMRYQVAGSGGPIWVAWGPPFTPKDTDDLIAQAQSVLPDAKGFELSRTREGRPVRGLHLPAATKDAPCLWIQARQHAWESGASWVARGFSEWVVGDSAEAKQLRSRSEIFIVPIMDVDNVATGNGGKEANPRDHNRDWDDHPVYPEVEAAQKRLKQLAERRRLGLFIDLHNPAPGDKRPFFFVGPPELLSLRGRERREQFLETAARHIADPLAVEPNPRVTGPSYHPLWKQISGQWVILNGDPDSVAVCLETSWNTPHSTVDGYRAVGRQLGLTVADWLANDKP